MSNFDFLKQNKIFNNFSESCIEAENGIGLNTVTVSYTHLTLPTT